MERFLAKVEKTDKCWWWIASKKDKNYGNFWNGLKHEGAHRASYELFIAPIPSGLSVLHKCDNKHCVNPDHLFLGTQKDNLQDMYRKHRGRKEDTYKSGEEHCNAVLTNSTANEIRNLYKTQKIRVIELAKTYGVSRWTVRRVLNGGIYDER